MVEAENTSIAPPLISAKQCQVCQSQWRLHIERLLVKGIAYKSIADSIPDGPSRKSIANHAKTHMAIDSALTRAIMEEEADLLNQNYQEGVKGAFSNRAALNILIRKAYEDAINGITTVEPKDMVKMIELYDKMDSSSASQMVEEARASVNIFMEAIRNVFTDMLDKEEAEALQQAIVVEVKRLREQNELEAKIENQLRAIPSGSNSSH